MSDQGIGITHAAPTWCNKCGEHFNRMTTATNHICRPNDTGFNPGDTVRVRDSIGRVSQIDRGLVEVYFRGSFRPAWCSPDLLERVA